MGRYNAYMPVRINNNLRDWVRSVLKKHGSGEPLTLGQAVSRTNVAKWSIAKMNNGENVHAESVILFAVGFGEDVESALRVCGYPEGQNVICDT